MAAAARLADRDRQKKEKELELRRKNYKSPAWTSDKPRPDVDPTIWDDRETADVLATYIDWHSRHPHSVTPRPREDVKVTAGKDIQVASPRTQVELFRYEDKSEAQKNREAALQPSPSKVEIELDELGKPITPAKTEEGEGDENKSPAQTPQDKDKDGKKDQTPAKGSPPKPTNDDPLANASFIRPPMNKATELVFYSNGVTVEALSPEFKAPRLGANGNIAQVTKLALKLNREAVSKVRYDLKDTWYTQSVKDGLETYHIDGDHTSVVLRPPKAKKKSAEQLAFEADMKWKEEQYGRYKGGGPSLTPEQQLILEKLAVNVPTDKEKKNIVGPWEEQHKWSKYTEEGTLLDDFNAVDLERKIKQALEAHEELIDADKKRKARLKKERAQAKRATREKNASAGLSAPTTRPTSSQIHPMGRVEEGIDESISLMSQDRDDATMMTNPTYGGSSVGMGGDMTIGEMSMFDGSQGSPGGNSSQVMASSVGSGSTYRHKGHGQPSVGPLSIGTGASQNGPYKGGPPVMEGTIQAALDYVQFQDGEADGTSLDGSVAGQSIVSNLDGKSVSQQQMLEEGKDENASHMSGMTVVTKPPQPETKADKKKRKLNNFLAGKGISSNSSVISENSTSSKVSLFSFGSSINLSKLIPNLGIMDRFRGGKRKADEGEGDGKKKKKKKKKSDGEEEEEEEEEGDVSESESEGEEEDKYKDKYDIMREQLGGDAKLEAAGDEWLKFAAYVRKKAKKDTNMFDTSLDLPDAVDKSNLSKTVFMLAVGGADPNMKANNEEPLVINVVNKIIQQDNITGSLEDDQDETPDRVRAFRVLQALIKFGCHLNTTEAKNGVPPLHLAVAAGNLKLINYLVESGADPNFFSADDTTPLMNAAKYGHIKLMAYLLRQNALLKVKDSKGRNVLHHAGMWGMTRASLFLLRCGIDKRIKDNDKLTPGALAEAQGHIVTAQAIMTFAVAPYKAQFALQYFIDQERNANEPKNLLDNLAGAAGAALAAGMAAVGKAFSAIGNGFKAAGNAIMGMFGFGNKDKIDTEAAFASS